MTTYAYAVFDTETTGLWLKDRPDTAEGQPRMASLSIVRASPTWSTQSEQTYYIKPDGWEMPPEATAVNGLTTEWLHQHGVPVKEALGAWINCLKEGRAVCAYGLNFDIRVLRAELERAGMPLLVEETMGICAMVRSIGVVKKKDDKGRTVAPTLAETMAHLKIPQHGAHTSLGDTISTKQVLHKLATFGIRLQPEQIPLRKFKPPKQEGDLGEAKKGPRRKTRETSTQTSWLRPQTPD